MIQLKNVSKAFQVGDQPVHALVDINEHIRPGEYVAIMGPSGSGKSTLLNLIGCLLRPTTGSFTIDGRDIGSLDDVELSRLRQSFIGFIFQSFHLIPRLTATGNVELPMMFAGIPITERQQRARHVLDAVGLTSRANHHPAQLSVGQRQRVVIARAMVMKPKLILADEPTGNLDRASGEQVLQLLDQLHAEGKTLLMVTHAVDVAKRAERILVIADGKIVQRIASTALDKDPVLHPALSPSS